MNYFELYPGDYLRDTTRLTLIEHGAYLRLLMAYYAEETPLPADETELFVIVSAVSAADKAAVRKVAARFFPVGDDGLRRNGRADKEIAKAEERMIGADERKGNEKERQRRTRARRTKLFYDLREVGIVPDAMSTMDELRKLHAEHVTRDKGVTQHVTNGVTERDKYRDCHGVNTATRPQTPYTNQEQKPSSSSSVAGQPARPPASLPKGDDDGPVPGEQDLPSWIPRPLWREFYRHRAVLRKPLSIPGQRQVVRRLVELSEAGHDIAASLRQTMAAGLVIPVTPKDPDHANVPASRKLSAVDQVAAKIRERREREHADNQSPFATLGHG